MKKYSKSILYLTIIILIITVAILIAIIMNLLKRNKVLINNEMNKEQLGEITNDTAYVEAESHFEELKDEQEKLLSFKSSIATAITNEGITTSLSDTASTMVNNISNILKTKTTLSSNVAATADNISVGKKAWVNGQLITGTLNIENDNFNNRQYAYDFANTTEALTVTHSYTVESDCTLAITQIVSPVNHSLTITKNGITIEPNMIVPITTWETCFASTEIECKDGDVIKATCGVPSTTGQYNKIGYIEINRIR